MDKQLNYLKSLETGIVSDALTILGIEGWTNNLFPVSKDLKIVGKAFTALYTPTVNGNEKTYVAYEVIDMCKAGDVLVIAGAQDGRIFGGNLATHALNKGLEGVVLDGRTRDVCEIEKLMPLFFRGPINRPTDNRYKLTGVNVPIVCDGVLINPNDIIVGDRDGIIVIPANFVDDVIYQCEMIVEVENEMAGALKRKASGKDLFAILKKKKSLRK
jgi:regulator of RNase E activity RraA